VVDVLLAHAFYISNDTKQRDEKFRPYAPLATLYAASILRGLDYNVELFDATLQDKEEQFRTYLEKHNPRIIVIYEDSFNFLSKMCLNHVREATIKMVAEAKRLSVPVIISSSDASDDPHAYLSKGVDYIMLGEADITVSELVQSLLSNDSANLDSIQGVAYLDAEDKNKVIKTGPRLIMRKIGHIPFPARDLLDIDSYRMAWNNTHGYFSMNMVTTRGCPYSCTWCAKPIWGKSYAVRSPENVAEEMAIVKQEFSPDHIWFMDDIFGLKPGWVEKFAYEVTTRGAEIPFMIQSRADLMQEEVVIGLAQSGCKEVWIGAESGSQKVLDAMKKGITVAQIQRARELLGKNDIRACFFIQFGYPGETIEDIEATISLVRTLLPDNIGVSVSYPLPGTEFHEQVNDQISEKSHWAESNDLEIMFNGTFTSDYYRKLGDFLHRDLDARLNYDENLDDISALDKEWEELVITADQYMTNAPTSPYPN